MTSEEFETKQAEILEGFHPLLATRLRILAWEHGHSSGMEEVLGILRGLAFDFKELNGILVLRALTNPQNGTIAASN